MAIYKVYGGYILDFAYRPIFRGRANYFFPLAPWPVFLQKAVLYTGRHRRPILISRGRT